MTTQARPPFLDPELPRMLQGLPRPRQALFLDRDGVINVDHGYVHTQEKTAWIPGIFELVASAHRHGYLPIVITNQAGIARGYYTEEDFLAYTAWMHDEFRKRGAALAATFYCPHHPHARADQLGVVCACRKPQPGMLLDAMEMFHLEPTRCKLLGDKQTDLEAALAANIDDVGLVDAQGHTDVTL